MASLLASLRSVWEAPATKVVTLLLPGQVLIQVLSGSTLSKVVRVLQNGVLFGSAVHSGWYFFKNAPMAITFASVEPILWTAIRSPESVTYEIFQLAHLFGYVSSVIAGVYVHDLIQNSRR